MLDCAATMPAASSSSASVGVVTSWGEWPISRAKPTSSTTTAAPTEARRKRDASPASSKRHHSSLA